LKNDEIVDIHTWLGVIEAERSPFLDLFVKVKEDDPAKDEKQEDSDSSDYYGFLEYQQPDDKKNKPQPSPSPPPQKSQSTAVIEAAQTSSSENATQISKKKNTGNQQHRQIGGRSQGRPIPGGVVVNEKIDAKKEPNYYVPRKKTTSKRPSLKTRTIIDNKSEANSTLQSKVAEGSNSHGILPDPISKGNTRSRLQHQKQQSRSTSRVPPTAKPSSLPFLMWPTGAVEEEGTSNLNDQKNSHNSDEVRIEDSENGILPTSQEAHGPDSSDERLAEILDHIQRRLQADKGHNSHTLFSEMKDGRFQDAEYELAAALPPNQAPVPVTDSKENPTSRPLDPGSPAVKPSDDSAGNVQAGESDKIQFEKLVKKFSAQAVEILKVFVPPDYPSAVTRKYYGAIKKIIQVRDCSMLGGDQTSLLLLSSG
jgi:hypothetical protein